ncbi:MAG: hypothetical protein MK207_08375 [Saprospiraceae bacterium]|nr:hypothetical protein [Saprospiraceae bacterium]
MKILLYFSFLMFLVSCSDSKKSKFSAFDVKNNEGTTIMSMGDDGTITFPTEEDVKVTLNENYELLDDEGKVRIKLNGEGMLVTEDGENIGNVSESGEIDFGTGVTMKWSENGELMKGNEATGIMIEPNNSNSYRAASILMNLYFMASEGMESEELESSNDSILVENPQDTTVVELEED